MNYQTLNNQSNAGESAWSLCRGIKSLLRCDEAETVQEIARYVISKYRSLSVGAEFVERNRNNFIPLIAAFLGSLTRFLEVRNASQSGGAVWVAHLSNERRVIEPLSKSLSDLPWTEVKLRRHPDLATVSLLPTKILPLRRRIFKLTRQLLKRGHKFFKILRVIELLGYYARYLDIFQKGNFSFAVMSSHSNPHGIAFNLAARRCGIPTVLITHGLPIRPVARLRYDLAVLHCEFARQVYLTEDCQINQIIIQGRREHYAVMPARLPATITIGIFLCKDVNEKRLDDLTKTLLADSRVMRILIRPHPKNLFVEIDAWLNSLGNSRVSRSLNESVIADLDESDVILGGNSSVLVEAVVAGRPSGYVRELDYATYDLHEFVARDLIYLVENAFEFDQMLTFYQKPEWVEVLKLYANIDEDEKVSAGRLKVALLELATRC